LVLNIKTISNQILEVLKDEDLAIFEIAIKINKSEVSIRNVLNKNLKKRGLIQETGIFRKNPHSNSKRGYKVYTLNEKKDMIRNLSIESENAPAREDDEEKNQIKRALIDSYNILYDKYLENIKEIERLNSKLGHID